MQKETQNLNSLSWLKQLPSPIALLDMSFNLIDASDVWYNDFGFNNTNKKPIGKSFFKLFPTFKEDWRTRLTYAADGLVDIQIIDKWTTPNGEEKSHIWYLNPWKDGYGKNIGVILKTKDNTRTKALDLELSRTKHLLNQKGNIAKVASWEYDVELDKISWSPSIEQIFGIQKNMKLTLDEYINFYKKGYSRENIKKAIKNAIKLGKPWNENLYIVTTKNKETYINTIGRPKFKNGICSRIIGTVQDITEKVYAKKAVTLLTTENSYEQFFESSPVPTIVIDYNSSLIVNANNSMVGLTGYTKEEILNSNCYRFGTINKPIQIEVLKRIKKNTNFKLLDLNVKNKKNQRLTVDIEGQLIIDAKNNKKVIVSIFDVTLRKKQNKVLLTHNDVANEEIEKLVNFAHMTSHNLKGHATNLSLLLNFLENENDAKKQKEIISLLSKSSSNLTESIKGLREIVSIRQNIHLKKKPLPVNEFVYSARQNLSGIIKKEDARIINEIGDHEKIMALPAYLESILFHIIGNALKFKQRNKRPIIILNISKEKDYTIISIEDNGIGIDLDKYKDRLYGLYKSLGYTGESRGMGLYLVRYQMELLNGKIECKSQLNEGTRFKLFFPNK